MADAFVREYRELATDAKGRVMAAGREDGTPVPNNVSYTTSTQSAAFGNHTHLIRVMVEADAWADIGSAPVAVKADGIKLNADVEYYFGVLPTHKIAFYDGAS